MSEMGEGGKGIFRNVFLINIKKDFSLVNDANIAFSSTESPSTYAREASLLKSVTSSRLRAVWLKCFYF